MQRVGAFVLLKINYWVYYWVYPGSAPIHLFTMEV